MESYKPTFWPGLAKDARLEAEATLDPQAKQIMLGIASDYEKIAKRIETYSNSFARKDHLMPTYHAVRPSLPGRLLAQIAARVRHPKRRATHITPLPHSLP